jgi:hypothetical protein
MFSIQEEKNQNLVEISVLSSTDRSITETKTELSSVKKQHPIRASQTNSLSHQNEYVSKLFDANDDPISGTTISINQSDIVPQRENPVKKFLRRINPKKLLTNTKNGKITPQPPLSDKKHVRRKPVSKPFARSKNRVESLTTKIEEAEISSTSKFD